MKKLLVIVLLIALSSLSFANIIEFFESIPPIVKFGIEAGIGIYGLAWAYPWFFDPIVIVGETDFGAFCFGPFIVINPYLWSEAPESSRNIVLNHEYVHYIQHALFGPILSLSYPIFSAYSILKTGNQWDANPWELQAIRISDTSKPDWEPSFVVELD